MLTRCGVNLQPVSAFSGPAGEQADGPISGELSHPTKGYVRNLATGVIVTGVLAVICGIVAVAWPKIPLLALAILIGLTLISLGALSIANAFQHDLDAGARALSGVLGLFGWSAASWWCAVPVTRCLRSSWSSDCGCSARAWWR